MRQEKFTDEDIKMANNMSIINYLDKNNIPYKKTGKTFKIEGYGGLYVDPYRNRWNCFSQNKGGGIIQLIMFMENKTWYKSMNKLLDSKGSAIAEPFTFKKQLKPKPKEFKLPEKNTSYKHMMAYLIKTRGIDKDIVYRFIKSKQLYEDKRRNCVFVGYNENNKPAYAGKRGTNSSYIFKGEEEGSNKAYSFNLKGISDKLYVFESPIELMSYLTLNRELGDKDHLLSLSCLAPVSIEKYLENNPNIREINLRLNNDKWGIKAMEEIKDLYKDRYDITIELPKLEDWNDELVYNHKISTIDDEWEMEI